MTKFCVGVPEAVLADFAAGRCSELTLPFAEGHECLKPGDQAVLIGQSGMATYEILSIAWSGEGSSKTTSLVVRYGS